MASDSDSDLDNEDAEARKSAASVVRPKTLSPKKVRKSPTGVQTSHRPVLFGRDSEGIKVKLCCTQSDFGWVTTTHRPVHLAIEFKTQF